MELAWSWIWSLWNDPRATLSVCDRHPGLEGERALSGITELCGVRGRTSLNPGLSMPGVDPEQSTRSPSLTVPYAVTFQPGAQAWRASLYDAVHLSPVFSSPPYSDARGYWSQSTDSAHSGPPHTLSLLCSGCHTKDTTHRHVRFPGLSAGSPWSRCWQSRPPSEGIPGLWPWLVDGRLLPVSLYIVF